MNDYNISLDPALQKLQDSATIFQIALLEGILNQ